MLKRLVSVIFVVIFSLSIVGCVPLSNEPCYICGETPTRKFVTINGTDRYYCKNEYSKCFFCDKKATKNYTNGLDFHIFVCDEHYKEMTQTDE